MAMAEVRDHALWIKHIHGDNALTSKLDTIVAGALIELIVDGFRGQWRKMDDGKNGKPTPGLCAIGPARDHWHGMQGYRDKLAEVQAG